MNRITIIALLAFLLAVPVWAQQAEPTEVGTADFEIKRYFDQIQGRISIDVEIGESILDGSTINATKIKELSKQETWPTIAIKDMDSDKFVYIFWGSDVGAVINGISIAISGAKEDLVRDLKNGEKKHYVFIDKDLILPLDNGKSLKITPATMRQKTSDGAILISDKEAKALIEARGGEMYMYDNKIDFGVESDDSDTPDAKGDEYTLSFTYSQRLKYKCLKWNTVAVKGQISTDSDDPLSRFHIYPVNVNLYSSRRIPMNIVGQLGLEGNQKFTNGRFNANLYWQGITPNLIDLTQGKHRLRLKPVLKLGVKGFQEFDNNRDESSNELSGEAYAELYYYIPILEYYSLLLEANVFYVFSNEIMPEREIRWNYDATLGIKIPGTDFKIIAKYSFGENDMNFVKDDKLLLGFAMDILNIPSGISF